jgi:hypothetical protein
LYSLGCILSKVIRDHIIRALGREHKPEQFHSVAFRKAFDMDQFAMALFGFRPCQAIYPTIGFLTLTFINLTIIFERANIELA